MKAPLFAIYVTLAVVIAVVLFILVPADRPGDARPDVLEEQIVLVMDAFAVDSCEEVRVVGSYRRTDATGFRQMLAYSAPMDCIEAMRAAALARGFAEGQGGTYVLEDAAAPEILTIYTEPGAARGAFEWERTGQ
ncbi:hypothetical protein [Erythrobacter sp. HL-111]|uniref:hypothetical protein n=1 Tax=Erythrobacter sp. HL-111 TaxID=1798193 RepID=UPI0006D95AC4|nr:hypothetical protein [Erythrobacter sp. HL-111]KPP93257.1 MAG: putative inner membrane protein [Erythrobacteraceae bacterium HL-111]SDR89592.1 hypothetical protein SAMN04515621_0586 [Erythrobacter sp. HL-111]